MNADERYFVQFDGQMNGPYRREQLRELAVGGVVKPEMPAANAADGPWAPLGSLPGAEEIFPRRAAMGFKEGNFEAANRPGEKSVSVAALISAAQTEGPVLRPSLGVRAAEVPPKPEQPPNDVQLLVRAVQAKEAEHAPPPPPHRRRPNRTLPWALGLWALLLATLGGIRWAYTDRWDETSTAILTGWAGLGHILLVGMYLFLRKLERDAAK
jgi:hypothetical protein